jgi:3',5'-cyclic AMP phosphodiesterase CpdA
MCIESAILRFRDLATNPGDTITKHSDIIKEKGFVWWGWWHKSGESIPGDTFRGFVRQIDRDGFIETYLLDTGLNYLHQAKIKEIKWDNCYKNIDSPDWDYTPAYYKKRQCKAWFKITEIKAVDNVREALQAFSYVDVNEFFEAKDSVFKDFNDKQISSIKELKHQDRSIWFVRSYREGDSIDERLFYEADLIRRSNFPKKIIESNSSYVLWLSDLHFSESKHAFPLSSHEQAGKKLSKVIIDDLEEQGIYEVGAIIITGDLTWAAKEIEYDLCMGFIEDMMSWSNLSSNQIIICPGNHDIAFSDTSWEKDAIVKRAINDAKKNYVKFYTDLYSVVPNPFLASGRRILLNKSVVLEIASLNSSYLNQIKDVFQGHGYVGQEQLGFVVDEMEWRGDTDSSLQPYKIVILHHHLVPVVPEELALYGKFLSVVYDAGALCDWMVKHQIRLVLHGHMHHTKIVKESRVIRNTSGDLQWHEYTIASLGSTGVKYGAESEGRFNVYGIIDFTREDAKLSVRNIAPKVIDGLTNKTNISTSV